MEIFKKHPQWNDVKKICTKLHGNGYTAWLAGGCVRDGLLGIMPKDFDIATNARPKKVESFFNKTVDVGKAFGVIRVIEASGDIEVATFRKDGSYTDGRRPDSVELATPQEDAKRRDFTINALFYDIFEGEVHDFVNGMVDLKSRIIRTVGLPEDRFLEDKLRIIRAVRFVSQLDFQLDKSTYDVITKFSQTITTVSWERISDELEKLLSGIRPDRGLELLQDSGLLDVIFPELIYDSKIVDYLKNTTGDSDQVILGWLFLFSLIQNADDHAKIFKRLKFSNEKAQSIATTLEIATSLLIFDRLNTPDKKKTAAENRTETAIKFLDIQNKIQPEILQYVKANRILPKPLIEAADLMSLGLKPGKTLGESLQKAFDAQLENEFTHKGEILTWIKQNLIVKPPDN
ncbi:MAG: CCA tRNA nucleotidyltransferase [Oligoflexia bacterium]|nr:CCA tRNA nucleotidyltransferase [Oligoflexia bacterium]